MTVDHVPGNGENDDNENDRHLPEGLWRTLRSDPAHAPQHMSLAAVELGLSNGRLEGLNSKVRLLSHRAYGFHSPNALIATIYLCCAGIQIDLPGR